MVEAASLKLLIDPWVSNPLSPASPQEVAAAKPTHILITHDHFDHLGESVDIAKATGAPVVGTYELTLEVAEKGIPEAQTMPMNIGGTIKLGDGVEVYMTARASCCTFCSLPRDPRRAAWCSTALDTSAERSCCASACPRSDLPRSTLLLSVMSSGP